MDELTSLCFALTIKSADNVASLMFRILLLNNVLTKVVNHLDTLLYTLFTFSPAKVLFPFPQQVIESLL